MTPRLPIKRSPISGRVSSRQRSRSPSVRRRGVQRSITKDSYEFLASHMGAEAASRFVPAADLIEEYLDTRIPDEFDTYTALVQLTDVLTRRAFSNEVIMPGRTTVGDVRRWLFDALGARGVRTWFQPDLRVQRKGTPGATSRGFLAVAPESTVIERGDVLHVDFGITYMGLNSDWQKMAYVLREARNRRARGAQAGDDAHKRAAGRRRCVPHAPDALEARCTSSRWMR